MSAYFAHSRAGEPLETWHLLADHLEDTARKADALSSNVGLPGWGRAAGVLHDVGKYSIAFQARVRGNVTAVDHSTAGAQLSNSRYGPIGRLLAYVIAGHHGGVPNGINRADRADVSRTDLVTRLEKRVDDYAAHLDEIVAPATLDAPKLAFHPTGGRDRVGFSLSHATRMAFSCLVDADYLDTERFYADSIGRNVDRGVWPSLGQLARQLDQHMTSFEADTEVRRLRADILASARQSAGLAPGLFSMSVPTGGGKTLSSLVWALSHARTHNLNRVVYVIPYTSIIEQNAEVFRKALGPFANCVLEHHSVYEERGSDEGIDKLRKATENWDAPLIVTSAVQFFESLYSNKPGRCRKLHHIANSVVILDEAQTLPTDLLMPCVVMLDEMARNYRTSILICTATQPAILEDPARPENSLAGGLRDVREIAPAGLHDRLRRVSVKFAGALANAELLEKLAGEHQVLCIVNTRQHARDLHDALQASGGARHLSTLMCAVHRSQVLTEIRGLLVKLEPVRLISTSLIEAGVDVDFPQVWRAMAGLSSIAQAAGRCNREGLRGAAESTVTVFEPQVPPPPFIAMDVAATQSTLHRHAHDPLSPAAIEDYFGQLYWRRAGTRSGLDKPRILPRIEERRGEMLFPFEDVARDFRMIETEMRTILIPFDGVAQRLLEDLRSVDDIRPILRGLQRYAVQVPEKAFGNLQSMGAITPVSGGRSAEEHWKLTDMSRYRLDVGLDLWM